MLAENADRFDSSRTVVRPNRVSPCQTHPHMMHMRHAGGPLMHPSRLGLILALAAAAHRSRVHTLAHHADGTEKEVVQHDGARRGGKKARQQKEIRPMDGRAGQCPLGAWTANTGKKNCWQRLLAAHADRFHPTMTAVRSDRVSPLSETPGSDAHATCRRFPCAPMPTPGA